MGKDLGVFAKTWGVYGLDSCSAKFESLYWACKLCTVQAAVPAGSSAA